MRNNLPASPQAETIDWPTSAASTSTDEALAALASRVATLERQAAAGRRWRFAFASLAVVVVSMGAAYSVNDAEFGTVKAARFEVVAPSGHKVASLAVAKGDDGSEEGALVVVSGQDKKTPFKATFVYPGRDLELIDKSK